MKELNKSQYKAIAKSTKPYVYTDAVIHGENLGEDKDGNVTFQGEKHMVLVRLSPRGVYQAQSYWLEREDSDGKWWEVMA